MKMLPSKTTLFLTLWVLALPLFQAASEKHRIHHRKSDDDKIERDEATCPTPRCQAGVYQVFDDTADKHGHKHAPSCIVLKGRAKVVIPLAIDGDDHVENKTIVVPADARAIGHCGASQQWITVMWNNTLASGKLVKTASLTLVFARHDNNSETYLTSASASVALFVEDGEQTITTPARSHSRLNGYVGTQTVLMSFKDAHIWATPHRFAYVCYTPNELAMPATTQPIQSTDDETELIIDPIYNDTAYLVFDDVKIETFRAARFTPQLTHLKFDCTRHLAYWNYVPAVVTGAMVASLAAVALAFKFRTELGFTGHLAYYEARRKQAAEAPESDASDDAK